MDPNTPVDTSDLYRDILDFAHTTPEWFQVFSEVGTDAGLLIFGALFVVVWWRARRDDPRALAVAVLAPLATAVAYVCSEVLKSLIQEERPCRAVLEVVGPLAECPPYGDWSFPSNHATIAGACGVSLALVWRGIAWLTLPLAVVMAFSRVFVGVHYPHDVAAGLVLGTLVVYLVLRLAARPVSRVTETMRGSSAGAVRWFAGPGGATAAPMPAPAPAPAQRPYGSQETYGSYGSHQSHQPHQPHQPTDPNATAPHHSAHRR
ncbi:phosphatase PAP2 family protein [Streptomyces apocyni]|nr:phosphatase PAP2 family protein [Streptomyces apocyni]